MRLKTGKGKELKLIYCRSCGHMITTRMLEYDNGNFYHLKCRIGSKEGEKEMMKTKHTGTNTPWGYADSCEVLAEGIISYSTPSHGGIRLSSKRIAQLPSGLDNFLHDLRWWEEDCDWVVPYILFVDDIRAYGQAYKFEENLETARAIASRYHPEIMQAVC